MTPDQFTPGIAITNSKLLWEWLRYEEAVYVEMRPPLTPDRLEWLTCEQAREDRRVFPRCWGRWLADGRIRQALRRTGGAPPQLSSPAAIAPGANRP